MAKQGSIISRGFSKFVAGLNSAGSVLILAIVVLINLDVFSRFLFNNPIDGVTELVELSIVAIVFLQLADAVRNGRLTRSDGLYNRLCKKNPTAGHLLGAFFDLAGAAFLKRKLDRTVLWKVLVEAGHIVASILMLIVAATMYSRMLGISGLPNELGEWIAGADIGLYGILTVYVILLIILGTILDTTSIILIMVPLFLPVVVPYGVDLVWFGIITIVGAEIGLLTPPLGISCYVIKSTLDDDRISLYDIFAGAFPFAVIMLLVLIILIAFPQLSLFLV